MPPEQATGEPVDERADVYALGAILRNVLTGTLPLPADADIEGPAPVVEICKRAMAWEPADRYPDAGAFAAGLETALAGLRPGVVVARSRMRLWLAAAIAVAAIAVIAVVWGARRDAVGKAPQMRVISRVPPGQLFLSLSPDGNRLAYNGRERVHVLDLRTGQNWSLTAWTTWPWVISFDTDNVVRFGVFDERDGGLMRRTTWNFQTGEVVDVSAAASIKSGFWIGRLTIGDLFLPSDVARHMVVQSPTGTTALPSDSLRPIRLFAIAPDRDRVAFVEYGDAGERIRVIDATGRGFVSAQLQDLAAISWLDDQTLIYSVGSSHGSTLYTARMTPEGFANPSRIYQSESGGWLGSLAARPNRIIASWFTSSFETRIHTREATERPLDKSAVSAALGWLDDSTFLAYSSSTGRVERASTEPTVLPQPTSMRLPGDPANATRVGDLVIVALRGTAGTRTVLAHDLREATPRWTAAPGELLFVRCAGDRQLPCVAGKHVGATVKLLPIDPQTGKLGDTVIAEGGIADAAIDDAGTHVVFIVDNRDLLIRPLDLSVPAQPLLPVRSANHSLAIDPLGGVLASVYALDGRELARINDGKATTVLHAGTALLSLIRPSPDGKLILFRARTLVGDVVEIRR